MTRQEDDCRALCEKRGWEVGEVYVDNDVSAYSGKPRPQYREELHKTAGQKPFPPHMRKYFCRWLTHGAEWCNMHHVGFNGYTIKELRQRSGLNQSQLAERAGCLQGTISNIEAGRKQCSDDLARQIAQVLCIADLRIIRTDPGDTAEPVQ